MVRTRATKASSAKAGEVELSLFMSPLHVLAKYRPLKSVKVECHTIQTSDPKEDYYGLLLLVKD